MSDITSVKLICPHCGAENESWGWSDDSTCISCGKHFEITEHVGSDKESFFHKIIEKFNGWWDDRKKNAKQK